MVAEVYAGISAFKTMFDLAKGLKDINDATIRNAAVIELQEKILGAQETQTSLIQRVSNLEKQVAEFETWETDKNEYEMKSLPSGSIVYALKPEAQETKPAHYICAACYGRRKISIIQKKAGSSAHAALGRPPMYGCPDCKSEIIA